MSHWAESSVFPLGLIPHIIFVLIAVVYIGYRYFKYRKGYQLSLIFFVVLTDLILLSLKPTLCLTLLTILVVDTP